jgi:hypothetical protein
MIKKLSEIFDFDTKILQRPFRKYSSIDVTLPSSTDSNIASIETVKSEKFDYSKK